MICKVSCVQRCTAHDPTVTFPPHAHFAASQKSVEEVNCAFIKRFRITRRNVVKPTEIRTPLPKIFSVDVLSTTYR